MARARISGLRLWVVGDGVDAPRLRQLAATLGLEDSVQFLGEREDVGEWLCRADVFVLSSRSEGLPVSLLEAMAAGLPLIVSDVGGMPEVARMTGAAAVVPPGSPDALADAIERYVQQRHELPQLAERCWACYQEHFTPGRMLRDYMELYQRCLDGKVSAAQPHRRA